MGAVSRLPSPVLHGWLWCILDMQAFDSPVGEVIVGVFWPKKKVGRLQCTILYDVCTKSTSYSNVSGSATVCQRLALAQRPNATAKPGDTMARSTNIPPDTPPLAPCWQQCDGTW